MITEDDLRKLIEDMMPKPNQRVVIHTGKSGARNFIRGVFGDGYTYRDVIRAYRSGFITQQNGVYIVRV
jgi:hypothetical protein